MRTRKNKSLQVTNSIRAKVRLLHLILDTPKEFANNREIKNALKSQGSFASLNYSFEADNVLWISTNISLTTLKSKLSFATEGSSFETIDRMRIGAYEKILEKEPSSHTDTRTTKNSLKAEINNLKHNVEILQESNFHLLQALLYSKTAIESIGAAQNEKARDKLMRDSIKTIASILSLNNYPFNQLEPLTVFIQNQLKAVKQ